jgi:hypothetical protein
MRKLVAVVEHACTAAHADPPQPPPILLVVVDQDRHVRAGARVLDSPQRPRALRLGVDGRVERVAVDGEHDRDEMRLPVRIGCRQPCDARLV